MTLEQLAKEIMDGEWEFIEADMVAEEDSDILTVRMKRNPDKVDLRMRSVHGTHSTVLKKETPHAKSE